MQGNLQDTFDSAVQIYFIICVGEERTLGPHCVCSLHSTSLLVNLILDQQTLLSVAGSRNDIAVLSTNSKLLGSWPRWSWDRRTVVSWAQKNKYKREARGRQFLKGFNEKLLLTVVFWGEHWLLSSQESQSCSMLHVWAPTTGVFGTGTPCYVHNL